MRIERIEPSKHKKDRVLVFLEGGELLKITENELLRYDLRPDGELTAELLEEIKKSAAVSEMKARGARLTGSRMLSKKQVVEHLTRRGGDREAAEDTALWLEDLGAVDEAAYGLAIVRHYGAMGYGAGRVRQELHRRGVPKELWDAALEQLPPSEEVIRKFLAGKLRGRGMTPEDSRRLAAALQRRGFAWQEIRPVLNEWGQEIEET